VPLIISARGRKGTRGASLAGRRLDLSKTLVSLDDVPLIDDWLPEFDVGERHDVAVPLEPERALALALATPASSDRIVRALISARGMAARDETIERFFAAHRFVVLDRSPTEWVAGAVGAVWRPRGGLVQLDDAGAWRGANVAGTIKGVVDFRAEAIPGGSRLTTETRVKATDEQARRAFRRYWLAIGPFSALIRKRWLAAVMASAKRSAEPSP
jgi:hypothetical protein